MPIAKFDNADGRLRGRALQARRLRKWTAAQGLCAKCRKLTNYPDGFELDHIIALVNEGDDTEDQTQVLCPPCHEDKTAKDMGFKPATQFGADGRVKW